jgi:diadenosine tetraphosphate (Ap4A) HIT family hydrolase
MSDDTTHVNMAHARVEHQRETMEQIQEDDTCPFCREHLMKYHTKPLLYESEHWILTENFAPYEGTKHHYLLIAQKHCEGFWELSPEAKVDLFDVLDRVRKDDKMKGGTLVMRWGDTDHTGASVTHLHAQLVVGASRKEGGEPILTALGYKVPDATSPERE